jgi:hypothetical protein
MTSEKEDVFFDNEKPEEYIYDAEKINKFPPDIKTKNQFDSIEHSINHWHDGAVTAEMLNMEKK